MFLKPFTALVATVFTITALLALPGCEKRFVATGGDRFPDTPNAVKSYLALGDSYTIGTSVTIEQRFPNQAAIQLSQQSVAFKIPDIVATSGWTTGNLLVELAVHPPAGTYDIVTLLIGVNNQYQGRSQAEYRTHFTELLNKAIGYAGGRKARVVVLSIPDYSVTPFAQGGDTSRIAREINEFNNINKEISTAAGVHYLNITDISREARQDPSLIAGDGLHPSGKQYDRWSARLVPIIKAAL
ncbi:MAG: SGNH/GDSL hydrolase family protein [Chitinophagaceae bacterium]|nr:MAG: SGNH/GDSL hydrolase family protein [Chitinophagaceae bacterium]